MDNGLQCVKAVTNEKLIRGSFFVGNFSLRTFLSVKGIDAWDRMTS